MKNTLTKLAIALPLVLAATTSQAGYSIRIAMETTGGGSLPAGSIVFKNTDGSTQEPVTPTEPEVVNPFAQENPACDPFAVGYPGNSIGKDYNSGSGYINSGLGLEYRACKLKPVYKPKLLVRYASIIPSYTDGCNPNKLDIDTSLVKPACSALGAGILKIYYSVTGTEPSNYSYSPYTVQLYGYESWGFTKDDIDRIEFGGYTCNNLRFFKHPFTQKPTSIVICDASSLSYGQLRESMDKQFIVEVYGK